MSRKKYLKKNSKNQFSQETGIDVVEISGELDCHISKPLRIRFKDKQYATKKVAYSIHHNTRLEDVGTVHQTCGIDQCINPNHLFVDTAIDEYNNTSDKVQEEKNLKSVNNAWGKTVTE